MIKFLDLVAQYETIKPEVDAAIHEVIQGAAFIGGNHVAAFEKDFARYQQATCAVGVANGTDALEIALESLELPRASEIIVPANSFIASAEAVTRTGHKVVFADVSPTTYTIEPNDVKRRITSRTAAIIAVHLYGHPCDMTALKEIAASHNLRIIEDCAQAHGAEYKRRRVGAIGDLGAFSFYPGKNLGAYGDAGAIVTNDEHLAARCRMIANHGRKAKYDHQFEGRNSRLDGIQAAILSVKLSHLDNWTARRRKNADRYRNGLSEVLDLILPTQSDMVSHAYHHFVVRTPWRDELAAHLANNGIETGIHYPSALPKLPAYSYYSHNLATPAADILDSQILSLPIGEHLADKEIDTVVAAVKNFYAEKATR